MALRCARDTLSEADWAEHRPAVFGAAYRILGTVTDAEDVAQDVWIKISGTDLTQVRDLRAYLVTAAARRAYDVLTSARARRESYVGAWLPEPLLTGPDAAGPVLLDDTVSFAMLLVMERLSPAERVAFVLHEVFAMPYGEIAAGLDRTEAACRQLVSRAGRKLRDVRTGGAPARAERDRLLTAYRAARETGDVAALVEVLDPSVVYVTDGGGKVFAARKPIVGAQRVAEVLVRLGARHGHVLVATELNGGPGALLLRGDELYGATLMEITGGRITAIRIVLNPEKLRGLMSHGAVLRRLPEEQGRPRPLREEKDHG